MIPTVSNPVGEPSVRPHGRATPPEALPLLDVATLVGGGLLSGAGLLRGGVRGWLSTSLGTLLLYRGFLALQEHAARTAGEGRENDPRLNAPARTFENARPFESNPESAYSGVKGTCVSPGIVSPI